MCVNHLYWTAELQEAIKGGEQALQEQMQKQGAEVQTLITMLEEEQGRSCELTIRSAIVQEIQFRDITEEVYRRKVASENDFYWKSQMKILLVDDSLVLNMLHTSTAYNYEYVGHIDRLVMNPQTHKSFLTILTAFHQNYYVSIEGTTAVGKSSLLQELSKYLGKMYRVKNGSNRMTYNSLSMFLKGIAASGCWALIEDFNRADMEMLSLSTVLIETLRSSAKKNEDSTSFYDGEKFSIVPGGFLAVTMNKFHKGRNNMPESVSTSFRPVALIKPDTLMIAKVKLLSYGFNDYNNLATVLCETLDLIKNQLPNRNHYDFEMRTLLQILKAAVGRKESVNESEIKCLGNVIKDFMHCMLVNEDYEVFQKVFKKFFGTIEDYQKIELPDTQEIKETLESDGHSYQDLYHKKLLEIIGTIKSNQGTIVIGETYTGKSSMVKLAAKLNSNVSLTNINPKSLEMGQLFGEKVDDEWQDGLIPKTFRDIVMNSEAEENWVIFDGPMDTDWVENLNTALDNHQCFCVESAEVLYLPPTIKIIFEASDLEKVSPATISRCGIVYIDQDTLTWKQLLQSWFKRISQEKWLEGHTTLVLELFEWVLPPLLKTLTSQCRNAVNVCLNNLAKCGLELFETLLLDALPNLKERKYLRGWIQAAVVFSCVWSIGGCLETDDDKVKFDAGIREVIFGKNLECPLPPSLNGKFDALPPLEGIIFEFVFDFKARGQWKHWNDVIKNYEISERFDIDDNLIPTIDSARYSYILEWAIKRKRPFLVVGPRGTGKTAYLKDKINHGLKMEEYMSFKINLTPKISQSTIYNTLLGK